MINSKISKVVDCAPCIAKSVFGTNNQTIKMNQNVRNHQNFRSNKSSSLQNEHKNIFFLLCVVTRRFRLSIKLCRFVLDVCIFIFVQNEDSTFLFTSLTSIWQAGHRHYYTMLITSVPTVVKCVCHHVNSKELRKFHCLKVDATLNSNIHKVYFSLPIIQLHFGL